MIRINCELPYFFYRDPLNGMAWQSLPVPPKTAIFGMLGSAFGMDFKTLKREVNEGMLKDLEVGIKIIDPGYWNSETTNFIKNKNKINATLKNYISDMLLEIYLKSEIEDKIIDKIENPSGVLTLGDSDSIVYIKKMKKTKNEKTKIKTTRSILPYETYESNKKEGMIPSKKKIIFSREVLPFIWSESGNRTTTINRDFLVHNIEIFLEKEIEGYKIEGENVVLF